MTKTVNNVRVDRIATLIQEYNIDKIVPINGRRNCLPDYLSRYPHTLKKNVSPETLIGFLILLLSETL